MKLVPMLTLLICVMLSLQAEDQSSAIKEASLSEKKKDAYPGVGWKPKSELPKDTVQYPGVGWKPKNEDPKPHQSTNIETTQKSSTN